jgi:hypothetical protein
MLRCLIPLLLLTAPAMGANELRALVEASSTNYIVIRNPDNPAQGWDTDAGAWATYDRTDTDQQIALGSAVAAGAADEWQYADLPAGLVASASYGYDVYDSSNELIATGVTEQMVAHGAPVVSVTGNVGGNVTGSVGSVVGAVGSVTGNVGGNVAGSVASVTNLVTANVTQVSGSATAANNLGTAASNYSATRGLAGTALPAATPGANGGLPTVDASNRIAGLQGTINTLDTLWTQTNNGFTTISTIVSGTSSKIGNFIAAGNNTLYDYTIAMMSATATKPSGAPAGYDPAEHSLEAQGDAIAGLDVDLGGLTGTQPRINYEPSIKLVLSSRRDGTYTCDRPVRLLPGTFDVEKTIGIDTTKVFGSKVQVATVGTPTVSGGSITATELGPRDQYAMVQLGGTATASEERTVDVPLTMDNGDQITARFEIEVGE